MKVLAIQLRFCCKVTTIAFSLISPALHAQTSPVRAGGASSEEHLRSRVYIYDMHDGSSKLVYTADTIWEAPKLVADGATLSPTQAGGSTSSFLSRTHSRTAKAHQFRRLSVQQ